MLRREQERDGTRRWVVNHKRVYRIYREEGLAMRRKRSKRFRAEARVPLELPTRANQVWTMDFTRDRLGERAEFSDAELDGRLHAGSAVDRSGHVAARARVVRVLEWLKQKRGVPEVIQVDNGPEFISQAVDQWAFANGVRVAFYRAGQAGAECVHRKF